MSGAELVPHEGGALVGAGPRELTVDELAAQVDKIREVQRRIMKPGVHYGTIPGTEKPTLFKAGAETLCLLFRLAPEYEIVKAIETADEIAFTVRCNLVHIPTGIRYGSGIASATSREKRYQREARRTCPRCRKETIYHSKDPQGGWFCWKTKGGCGANFPAGDVSIEGQTVGRVTNPDLYDSHNAILKIAQKRALVGTALNCTGASDSFAQDLEDSPDGVDDVRPPPTNSHPRPAPPPRPNGEGVERPSMKQLRRYHELCERLKLSEVQGRNRISVFLKRSVASLADDLTAEDMSQVIAEMEKDTESGGAA